MMTEDRMKQTAKNTRPTKFYNTLIQHILTAVEGETGEDAQLTGMSASTSDDVIISDSSSAKLLPSLLTASLALSDKQQHLHLPITASLALSDKQQY